MGFAIIWTHAKFYEPELKVPILKEGKPQTSYRPIALTSCNCKVLERIPHKSGQGSAHGGNTHILDSWIRRKTTFTAKLSKFYHLSEALKHRVSDLRFKRIKNGKFLQQRFWVPESTWGLRGEDGGRGWRGWAATTSPSSTNSY